VASAAERIAERVAETISRYRMLAPGQRVGVAVSGGADSVCLLHVLAELAPRWALGLSVLHLNHRLRGEESHQDAEFAHSLAARLGLPFQLCETDVRTLGGNLEQAARRARLGFFREWMAGGPGGRVAVGHTRSDQAETVLFRFLRGAGSAGLAGIRPVTADGIVRPLLEVTRAEVECFLRERGIRWREDSTNAGRQFARNRLRHDLLPQLARHWNPGIDEILAHTADWALAEEEYWAAEVRQLAARCVTEESGAVLLRVGALRDLPLAAARRLVRHVMERAKGDLLGVDFRHVAAVLAMANGGAGNARCQAPGLEICKSFEWIRVASARIKDNGCSDFQLPAGVPGTVEVPGSSFAISLELIEKSETSGVCECVYNGGVDDLDWERLSGRLELRNWRPGDHYQPVGSAAVAKIKDLFQHARIPLWERRGWPVLTEGDSIVWALRFGPDARVAASGSTNVVLKVQQLVPR